MSDSCRTVAAAAIALLAAACVGGPPGDGPGGAGDGDGTGGADGGPAGTEEAFCTPTSGSRLRLEWHDAGATSVLGAIHDLELDTTCTPALAPDGVLRCLPDPVESSQFVRYRDAACTQPIFRLRTPTAPRPRFHQVSVYRGSCDPVPELREVVGEPFDLAGGTAIYTGGGGSCSRVDAEGGRYVAVSEPLPSSTFVALETARRSAGGRIGLEVLEGADGSRLCDGGGMYDEDHDSACTLGLAEDQVVRCLPPVGVTQRMYADDTCDTAIEVTPHHATCGAAPTYAGRIEHRECLPRTRVRALATSRDVVYTQGSCIPNSMGDDGVWYEAGAGLSPTTFAAASPVDVEGRDDAAGDARLVRRDVQLESGPRLTGTTFYDRELGAECRLEPMHVDGTPRCVPIATLDTRVAEVRRYFSDQACTTPVEVALLDLGCRDEDPPAYGVLRDDGEVRVHPVLAASTEPVYELVVAPDLSGSYCLRAGEAHARFTVGPALAPDALVAGASRQE